MTTCPVTHLEYRQLIEDCLDEVVIDRAVTRLREVGGDE